MESQCRNKARDERIKAQREVQAKKDVESRKEREHKREDDFQTISRRRNRREKAPYANVEMNKDNKQTQGEQSVNNVSQDIRSENQKKNFDNVQIQNIIGNKKRQVIEEQRYYH